MHPDQTATAPLDGLSALFTRNELPDAEQRRLRRLTSHLLQSHIHAKHPRSDVELVAYLLGQWEAALDDVDNEMELASESFVVHAEDAAWVLGREVGDVRAGIARLSGERIVSAAPTGEGTLVSFAPTIEATSPKLETQVYRDFLTRHGRLLHGLATFYLDVIGGELSEFEASDATCDTPLRKRYETTVQAGRPGTLLSAWVDAPERMYQWLDQLAAVELDLAVASGLASLGLRHDLHRFDAERVLILNGDLDPSR